MTQLNKVNVTYHAPEGDSKVVEMLKTTFYDGVAIDVICTKDQFDTLSTNQHFKVNSSSEYDPADEKPAHPEPAASHEKTTKR